MKILAENLASTTLASGIGSSDTTMTVASGTGSSFPAPVAGESYFLAVIKSVTQPTVYEIVRVTSVATDTFTIVRGQEKTSALNWIAGVTIANMITAGTVESIQDDIIDLQESDGLKAPLASPALTGNPTAPTPAPGDNDTSIATTAFVAAANAMLPTTLVMNFPVTTNFWLDVSSNTHIQRIQDRIFNGAAAKNDGKILTTPSPSTKDWLELIRPATTNNAQFAVLSTIGQCAVLGGSRTSDFALADSLGCIGGQFWGINDNATQVQTAYAAYFEARRSVGAGRTHGFEIDIINFGSAVGVQPYDMFQQGLTAGQWIASGGELSATKASVAIAIMNNGSTWDKGIVFHSTSLEGTNGITGSGVALEMAKGQAVRWMFGSGSLGATINSSVSNAAAQQSMIFSDTGLLYRNSASIALLQVAVSDAYVNGLIVTPGATGTGVTMAAQGSDTNIDLVLASKGTGLLRINNAPVAATAGSQAGFFSIKLGTTTYKIPYYAV